MKRPDLPDGHGHGAKKTDGLAPPDLTYDLDPEGDVVFVVHNTNEDLPKNLPNLSPLLLNGFNNYVPSHVPTSVFDYVTSPVQKQPTAESDAQAESKPKLLIRACSKHLTLASPYFARLLNGQFKEALEFKNQGYYICQIQDWDAEPFLLLLLIIHGQTRVVPRHITIRRLADIAILVDFYECHQVVEFFSELWIEDIKPEDFEYPAGNTDSLLVISWVFNKEDMFKSVTENIIKYSANEIEFHGLPIPETITAALNHERNTHIATILSPLQQLQKDLAASGWRACRSRFVVGYQPAESCTYMVLGSLTAHLYSLGLTMPEPAPAYPGVAAYELLGYCHEKMVSSSHNTIGEIDRVTPCGLGQRVCAALDTVRGLRGLDIDDPRFGRRRDTPGSQDLSDPDEEL